MDPTAQPIPFSMELNVYALKLDFSYLTVSAQLAPQIQIGMAPTAPASPDISSLMVSATPAPPISPS